MHIQVVGRTFFAVRAYAFAHKFISFAVLLAVFGGGWWVYHVMAAGSSQSQYVLGTVEKGTVVSVVSGSGQISASNEVSLTAKVSGPVTALSAKVGQEVAKGQVLAAIDPSEAAYDLETARISYEKLVSIDAPNNLRDANSAVTQDQQSLSGAYEDARAALVGASSNMTDVLSGMQSLFDGYLNTSNHFNLSDTARSYIAKAQQTYYTANTSFKALSKQYGSISADTGDAAIASLNSSFYQTATLVAAATKATQDASAYMQTHDGAGQSAAQTAYTSAVGFASTANDVVSSLSSSKASIVTATQALEKAQADLAALKNGSATLDARSAQLTLQQKQDTLNDHYITAPFSGVVAAVDAKLGDNVSSGGAIATVITKQKMAKISLNEVDAAKVAVGQKVTLTFDAFDDLTTTGTVIQKDLVGTVSQGVVSYEVEISVDSDDSRILSGMTVNADIQVAVAQDVLVVPSSAVKTQNGQSYVLAFEPPLENTGSASGVVAATAPMQIPVETGISDDANIEITSGLSEGQQIVVRTTTSGATNAAASGTRGFAGGGIRL